MSILAKAAPTTAKVVSQTQSKGSYGFKPAPSFHSKAKEMYIQKAQLLSQRNVKAYAAQSHRANDDFFKIDDCGDPYEECNMPYSSTNEEEGVPKRISLRKIQD